MNYSAILILILSVSMFTTIANAQECKQLCVAKQFYEQGEAVVISGKVDVILENTPLIIQVFKENNRIHIAQVDVSQDGSYTYTLIADGPFFRADGKYTVQASYGVAGNIHEASFDFRTAGSATNTTEMFEVNAGDA